MWLRPKTYFKSIVGSQAPIQFLLPAVRNFVHKSNPAFYCLLCVTLQVQPSFLLLAVRNIVSVQPSFLLLAVRNIVCVQPSFLLLAVCNIVSVQPSFLLLAVRNIVCRSNPTSYCLLYINLFAGPHPTFHCLQYCR